MTIPDDIIIPAVRALLAAARFAEADRLLDAADHPALALVRIEAVLARDWHHGAVTAPDVLHTVTPQDPRSAWTLDYLTVRRDYAAQLLSGSVSAGLTGRATVLRDTATTEADRGWAAMYLGLIADNLTGDRAAAPAHYRQALAVAEKHGDDRLAFEALRHLGDHAHDDGDIGSARAQWERSTWHVARSGDIRGTLAQQLLLAVLARDDGDEAGARLLAQEIRRWADAIGADGIGQQAAAFLAGADPTQAP